MRWDDEIRSPENLAPKAVDLTDDEVDAAIQLLETMARDDIDDYTDFSDCADVCVGSELGCRVT
ncbi:hypothetical protein ABT071_21600 [Streptomyces sp. NPDC002506]|uniref:hypothetical protein n=1 Tax=Streptomyces sp. NPDC002506 TaxID=3154536 RepID=UPI00331AC468